LLLPVVLAMAACSRDPKVQAHRYVENGNKFFEKGKYKEASIMYRRALQKDLRYGEAYYRLGLTDIKLAAFGDAARALRRAVELQPDNIDAATHLADIFVVASLQDQARGTDLRKEARELAQKILQQHPDSYEGHRILGQLALLSKDFPTAISELETANRAKPLEVEVALSYFQALASLGHFAEAEKIARQLIDKHKDFSPIYDLLYTHYLRQNKPEEAENLLKLKVANNPQQSTYLLQLGAHYFYWKKPAEMDAVFARLSDEKQFPLGHLLVGDFFFLRARDFERARREYEAGAKDPREQAAYQKRLVELYAATGKNDEANQLLGTVLKQNPRDNDAIALRAALMLQTGNREQINQAANDLQSLVTKNPNNHLMRYSLARALIARGDIDAARLQLEEAIKLRSDFVLAREWLARVYVSKGDPGRALKEADEILSLNRNDLQARLIRSSSLLAVGEKDKARAELEVISKLSPQNPDARYQIGFLAWQDKDYKRAEQIFGDLFRDYPGDSRGLLGVVDTLASEKRMDDAIQRMRDAVAKEPQRKDLKVMYGDLLARAERYDQAIQIYQSFLQADPKSPNLLLKMAEAQRRNGDLNAAMDTFRRAAQSNPSDPRPLLQLGLLMDGTGRRDQAKPYYEQILKIQPDQPVALNNLAYIKAEEGQDLDEALSMATRARQKMPNSPDIEDTLGWIYIKKNLSEEAVRLFKDLVAQQPNNASFHYHYGLALLQKGDRPMARKELEIAISHNPSKDDAGKIHDLLARM